MRVFESIFKFFNSHKFIRGISSCLIFIFFTFSSSISSGQNSLQNGLVAWYPFDGNASDMSGNGNHGIVNGAMLGTDRHDQANRAYSFDGVDDYVEVSNDGSFVLSDFSVSFFISCAVEFITSTNSSSLPYNPSAAAIQASLPD